MEPNVTPQPKTPSEAEVPAEQPTESVTPLEPTAPELTAQVDDLMATSAAQTAPVETPETSQVITPTLSAPEAPLAPESEAVTPEMPVPSEPLAAEPESLPIPPTPQSQIVEAAPASKEAAPVVAIDPAATPVAAPVSAGKKRSWLKPVLLGLVVLVGVAAISAAVYAEVIVPNRPSNVLMQALENSVQQPQVSYKGSVDMDSNGTAIKVGIVGAQDNTKPASDLQLSITTSGITLPVEGRLVDKNVYVKVGDLSPVVSLIGAFGDASTTKTFSAVSQQLSNKWVSIDSTLLKQAGVSCFTDSKFSLTQADVKLLEDQYKTNPFATIQSTANDTIDGQKVVKYQLSIDDDKAAAYSTNFKNISVVKSLDSCSKTGKTSAVDNSLRDHDKTPLTVWVNKGSKQIVQIASQSTSQDATKGIKGSGQLSFSYAPVSIIAPSESVPVMEVLANLEKTLNEPGTSTSGFDITKLLSSNVSGSLNSTLNR